MSRGDAAESSLQITSPYNLMTSEAFIGSLVSFAVTTSRDLVSPFYSVSYTATPVALIRSRATTLLEFVIP
jgi:hypothetical protein